MVGLIRMDMVSKAQMFAKSKHRGQKDDDGKDYFMSHIITVGNCAFALTEDKDIICASYLHDTIEDTDTTYEELVKEFNKRIADLVMEVTQEGKKDNYGYYFPRLKSKEGIMIKLIDRASNISRMDSWDEKRKEQYLKKTKFWKDGSDLKNNRKYLITCTECNKYFDTIKDWELHNCKEGINMGEDCVCPN